MLERSRPHPQYGGGLAVDGEQLARVTGVTAFRGNTPGSAHPTPWVELRRALRKAAEGVVQHSVRPGDVPQQTLDELARVTQDQSDA